MLRRGLHRRQATNKQALSMCISNWIILDNTKKAATIHQNFLLSRVSMTHLGRLGSRIINGFCHGYLLVMSPSRAGSSHSSSWTIFRSAWLGSWPFLFSSKKKFLLENQKIGSFSLFPQHFYSFVCFFMVNNTFSSSNNWYLSKKIQVWS